MIRTLNRTSERRAVGYRSASVSVKIIQSTCFSDSRTTIWLPHRRTSHLKNHFYPPPSMASHTGKVDKFVTHLWPIFGRCENGTKCPLIHKQSVCPPGKRECLSLVTFKKMPGTAIIQHGLAAEPPQGSVTVAESGGRDRSQGSEK